MTRQAHVAVRLPAEELARVDALLPTLSTPWRTATRSDALRAAILAGLPLLEPAPVKKKRSPKK